jgi:magnesium-transporting ATPase (P-type)
MVILSGATLGRSPLNVIQLLWANLIMDILAAIAIGTEPFSKQEMVSFRISRKDKIILPSMWRTILGQALYQIIVLIVLTYFGEFIFFDQSFNLIYTPLRNEAGDPTNRMILDTIVFHTFILMNMFNQMNCRVVAEDQINVFVTLFTNPLFFIVGIFEIGIQTWMIQLGSSDLGSILVGTAPLTFNQ